MEKNVCGSNVSENNESKDYMDYKAFRNMLFMKASGEGAEEFELYCMEGESLKVGIYKGQIDTYDASTFRGAGFRIKSGGKMGYAYTEIMNERSIEALVSGAMQNAGIVDTLNEEYINTSKQKYQDINTYSEAVDRLKPAEIRDFALGMEEAAYECDGRVTGTKFCIAGITKNRIFVANSGGLDLEHAVNGFYAYVLPVVKEKEEVRTGFAFRAGRAPESVVPGDISREAVSKAVSFLGAKPVKSGKYRVLLSNEAALDLLDSFSGIFSAERVQKGISLLKGKIGQQVASGSISIIDNPLMPDGLASRPFDCEGTACAQRRIVDRGILTGYLHNIKTARKDNVSSTGNASRSYSSGVGISPSNMYIEAGLHNLTEMLDFLGTGLYITDLEGLHAGTNPVSGDFSLSAKGFYAASGNLEQPVSQITIAGNIFEMLMGIEKTGKDIKFGLPGSGCFGSPSVLVSSLSVAGK